MDKGTRYGFEIQADNRTYITDIKRGCESAYEEDFEAIPLERFVPYIFVVGTTGTPLNPRGRNVNSQLSPNEMSHLLDSFLLFCALNLPLVAYFCSSLPRSFFPAFKTGVSSPFPADERRPSRQPPQLDRNKS